MPGGQFTIEARHVICVALICYCTGCTTLVLFPVELITWVSWVVSTLSTLATIGLIARAINPLHLPGEKYAYLVAGLVGLLTGLAYDFRESVALHEQARVSLLLLTGVIGAVGAFIAQDDEGGRDAEAP